MNRPMVGVFGILTILFGLLYYLAHNYERIESVSGGYAIYTIKTEVQAILLLLTAVCAILTVVGIVLNGERIPSKVARNNYQQASPSSRMPCQSPGDYRFCPTCGATAVSGAGFCAFCGVNLRSSSSPHGSAVVSITCLRHNTQVALKGNPICTVNGGPRVELHWDTPVSVLVPSSKGCVIEIGVPYLGRVCGKASFWVTTAAGETQEYEYQTPLILVNPGKISRIR